VRTIERAVRAVLVAIGENPNREGLRETPARVARLYRKVFSGLGEDPTKQFRLFRVGHQDGVVVVRDIPFQSMCEHHLLPFFGKIHLAYLPRDNRVTGLNSLTRVAEVLSRRPQLQERLTNDIADALMECLRPRGLLVVTEAQHLCMSLSEVGKRGATAVSSAARGEMLADARRREALLMMNLPRVSTGLERGRRPRGRRVGPRTRRSELNVT
jgi:GTP cyclohydrolase I